MSNVVYGLAAVGSPSSKQLRDLCAREARNVALTGTTQEIANVIWGLEALSEEGGGGGGGGGERVLRALVEEGHVGWFVDNATAVEIGNVCRAVAGMGGG